MKASKLLTSVLGRRLAYRLGRALYMEARGDLDNAISTNGEAMIQRRVVDAARSSGAERLVCLDVGGFVGDWSAAFWRYWSAQRRPPLTLHVFEPAPSTARGLRERLSAFPEAVLSPLAMSSEAGDAVLNVDESAPGINSLVADGSSRPAAPVRVVKTTIARYAAEHGIESIDLLKIDTEGHDFDVILGSLEMLRSGRIAVVQFEYNHRWVFARRYLHDVFDLARALPYRVAKIWPDHIEILDQWHPEMERFFEANYLLIRKDALGWFDCRDCAADQSSVLVAAPHQLEPKE